MPNYHLTHNQSVQALEHLMLSELPGVKLAGASYYGVGIGACIENGKNIAGSIIEDIIKSSGD